MESVTRMPTMEVKTTFRCKVRNWGILYGRSYKKPSMEIKTTFICKVRNCDILLRGSSGHMKSPSYECV